MDISEKLAT